MRCCCGSCVLLLERGRCVVLWLHVYVAPFQFYGQQLDTHPAPRHAPIQSFFFEIGLAQRKFDREYATIEDQDLLLGPPPTKQQYNRYIVKKGRWTRETCKKAVKKARFDLLRSIVQPTSNSKQYRTYRAWVIGWVSAAIIEWHTFH